MICIFEGPEHTFQFVNPPYQTLVGPRPLLGLPIAEAMPELAGQPIFSLLDQVYQTGETFRANEMLVQLDHANDHPQELEKRYYNFIYQARHGLTGATDGILVFAYDVSEQVLARQQRDALNQELTQVNTSLRQLNDEQQAQNQELARTQQLLRTLNQELEARVAERTQEAREARAEAERQRQRLELMFQQVPAMVNVLTGPDHVFELVSPLTQRLMGTRQLIGRPIREALPELPAARVAAYDHVYRTGETVRELEVASVFPHPDGGPGAPFFYDLTLVPLRDEQQRIEGVMVFAFETTERVLDRQRVEALQTELLAAAQAQAQEREQFYQIFEQAPAGVALLREPGHRFDYANPTLRSFLGGQAVRGRAFAELAPELVEQGFIALLDRVYQTGELYFGSEALADITQPDGSSRTGYYNFTYQAYREEGAIAGISIFAFDVTEQVLARQAREAQQALLSQVFAQAPVAICVFGGPDYVLDVVNPQMADMLGRPVAKLLGRPLFEALPELRDQDVPALLDGVRRTGQPFVAQELPVRLARHAPGETGYYNFVYQPLRDEQGLLTAVVCVAIDVTEQVLARERVSQANAALSATNEQLTRTNADLDNFIYVASHDLRAPISNLEGLLLALVEDLPPAARQTGAVQPVLDMMQAAIGRFQLTISQLTDLTRLQQAHAQPAEAVDPVDLAALAEAVRLDLLSLTLAAGASLTLDVAAAPTVALAPKNLRSILFNLLSNAIKYRHPDRPPVVSLRAYRPEAGGTRLEVQDNGLGLDPSQQSRLFGMFERLHDHVEGTGIGLYTVKRIVENAGGRIRVESELGTGSKFIVELPGGEMVNQ